jgi:hypothetical protein
VTARASDALGATWPPWVTVHPAPVGLCLRPRRGALDVLGQGRPDGLLAAHQEDAHRLDWPLSEWWCD